MGPDGCKDYYPLLNVDDIIGGIFIPSDGQADPVGITQALAKGARMGGAQIFEKVKVEEVLVCDGKAVGVQTDKGDIAADFVVLACSMWTRTFAAQIGLTCRCMPANTFTCSPKRMMQSRRLPVYRDDACAYYKEDAGKMLLGAFETVAKPWGMEGIPEFEFGQLPDDFEHFMPILEVLCTGCCYLKILAFRPSSVARRALQDDRYHIGPAPKWIIYLSQRSKFNRYPVGRRDWTGARSWMRDGLPPFDLNSVDIRRNMSFQSNSAYLRDRVTETLGPL